MDSLKAICMGRKEVQARDVEFISHYSVEVRVVLLLVRFFVDVSLKRALAKKGRSIS